MTSSASVPALSPPSGQTSNFVDPGSLFKWCILCVSVCLSVTTVVFILRIYVRVAIKREWIFEDYMCCASWIGLVTYCASTITLIHKHGGVHEWNLTNPDVHKAIRWINITSVEYALVILSTKLAILLLYRRIFLPQRGGYFDWFLRFFMLILGLFYFATTIVKIWECSPRARIWDKSIKGICVNVSSLFNTSGLFNVITDVFILLVPIKSVWNLQMTRKRKLGVVLVFTVGLTAPVFSMIGLIVRLRVSASPDVTYHYLEIVLWAAAEVSTGLICVCIPTLATLRHRRLLKPAASTLSPRCGEFFGRNGPSSLDEENLFHKGNLELKEGRFSTHAPPHAAPIETKCESVFLAKQNRHVKTHKIKLTDCGDDFKAPSHDSGIMKTVRLEHCYA